ncbi:hypothetical protein HDE68_004120 [Pedobacter cryoconitis]|uniref:Uncharacterized protein n=1 Tax=Pedobacter cryoconitis TaxID=188932 RepID=A0A7W8ZQ90_9SPHI|nr:hypothetical protein [Pedobacter cryoconitis]
MLHVLQTILDWSEIWALFIPAAALLYIKQPVIFKPVVLYIWLALVINKLIDVIWKFKTILPASLNSNNSLYNLHSVFTFFLFSSFFIYLKQPFILRIKKIIPFIFLFFVIINFTFYENFFYY